MVTLRWSHEVGTTVHKAEVVRGAAGDSGSLSPTHIRQYARLVRCGSDPEIARIRCRSGVTIWSRLYRTWGTVAERLAVSWWCWDRDHEETEGPNA